jgi:hypothetical protein
MEKFRHDPDCAVFLSTDAGGVGLNLQAASAVVNFEPPWNPARLEQRIGRVHRLGQTLPVQVIHLLTSGSIEERVWETLRLKQSLFSGVFDSPTSEVSFAALGRKTVLQEVKEIFADRPGNPKPIIDPAPPEALPAAAAAKPANLGAAAAGLLEAGVRFLESLAPGTGELSDVISSVLRTDPQTHRPMLAIPLPESVTQARLVGAITGLLRGLASRA